MPDLQAAGLHGLAHAARMINGVDGAHVIAMAVLFLAAIGQAHAERSAEQRGFDIVDAERVAAEQAWTQPPRISAARPATPPVCTTTGPATTTTFSFCSSACRTSAAVWRTAVSTWRSEEMPLDMKANASRSRSFDSGATRMPRMPTTMRSPARRSRRRRQKALAVLRPRSWRPCAGSRTSIHCSPMRT